MNYQLLFSRQNKKRFIDLSSAESVRTIVSVKELYRRILTSSFVIVRGICTVCILNILTHELLSIYILKFKRPLNTRRDVLKRNVKPC